ncbi:MAG: DUF962 domain-containing protein [Gammaproteobacteria bacterium]|nr:DUF962 domain-containing protein [Gammaproteobacteria bacterium]
MKPVSKVLGEYAAYHRHPLNRMTHYFGIPLIVFSLLLILSIPSFIVGQINISAADLIIAIIIIWYLLLDTQLGLLSALFLLPVLLLAALATSTLSGSMVNGIFALTFIAGWILQLLGHRIEKRRPALVDNFMQVFSAPLFLVSELVFHIGLRQPLATQVDNIAKRKALEMTLEVNN